MREIKFRAWDKRDKKMFQPKKLCRLHFNKEIPYAFYTWDGDIILHGALILMQYTGLKDKNGKEIYEGDVVKHGVEPTEVNYIEFYDAQYHLEPHGLRLCDEYEGIEIIGNIYENPDLIKEKI